MTSGNKVIIIGSGFGGLGAAARLAARGYQVDIFEKLDKPGGRGYVFEKEGFKFDAGPTVITAPFMFDDIFALAGRRREEYVQFVQCDPFYRIFNHEGRSFDYNHDHQFILSQIEQWNPADKLGYERFMGTTKAIFEKGFVELADKPFCMSRICSASYLTCSNCNPTKRCTTTPRNLWKTNSCAAASLFIPC